MASKPGLQIGVRDVTVAVNQAFTADLRLDVEEARQSVTVSSSAIAVQGQTVKTGSLINEQQIDMLPLNGRNFQRLLALTPGVGGFDAFGESILNSAVNGTRPAYNNFMVDGVGANDERLPTGLAGTINSSSTDLGPDVPNVISTEALQEYRVIASTLTWAPDPRLNVELGFSIREQAPGVQIVDGISTNPMRFQRNRPRHYFIKNIGGAVESQCSGL